VGISIDEDRDGGTLPRDVPRRMMVKGGPAPEGAGARTLRRNPGWRRPRGDALGRPRGDMRHNTKTIRGARPDGIGDGPAAPSATTEIGAIASRHTMGKAG